MEMGEGYNDRREKSGPYDLEWGVGAVDGGCHRVVERFFVLRARYVRVRFSLGSVFCACDSGGKAK